MVVTMGALAVQPPEPEAGLTPVLEATDLVTVYYGGEGAVRALDEVSI